MTNLELVVGSGDEICEEAKGNSCSLRFVVGGRDGRSQHLVDTVISERNGKGRRTADAFKVAFPGI